MIGQKKLHPHVLVWLVVGLVMIYLQIVIGGITRLTESGLSITKWEVVTGSIPPLNSTDWLREFELYQETPQYRKLNQDMSLQQFKWIYFWEYLHRLWARLMGMVFLVGFVWFLWRRRLSSGLIKRLLVTVLLAGLAGVFGWIMVASGLIERPWVNAYKLTIHLGIALLVFGHHLITIVNRTTTAITVSVSLRKKFRFFLILLCVQIFFGGLMSGMKASLVYPTFPDFQGSWFPTVLLESSSWSVENVVNYDKTPFMAALVQVLHRLIAYVLTISMLYIVLRHWNELFGRVMRSLSTLWIILLVSQICFGVLVLIGSKGTIPVFSGVMHQAVAILLLCVTLVMFSRMDRDPLRT